LCPSCRALFYTAQVLVDNAVSDEDEIIATMVYAAWKGRPLELVKSETLRQEVAKEFSGEDQEFELLGIVDGVPILRLKTVVVCVVRYEGLAITKRVRISVLSRFASPEAVAERYERTLRDEGMPWDHSNSGAVEWDTMDNRLNITLAPTKTYAPGEVLQLSRTARELWPSFPPPELVREFYRTLLGSFDKRTFRGFASYLGAHGRPLSKAKDAKTLIPACTAWLIGERKGSSDERPRERRPRIAGVLNRHLLGALDMPELPEGDWTSANAIWRDTEDLTDRLGRASYFFQTRATG
jgi:hypothetical protein